MPERLQPENWESRTRRVRDLANILPILAALLLLPPVILLFAVPVSVGDIPLVAVYLYGVWAIVIFLAFVVARRLEAVERHPEISPAERD